MRASASYTATMAGLLLCFGLMLQAAAAAGMAMRMSPSPPSPTPYAVRAPPPSPIPAAPVRADRTLARKAYPWCKTSLTTAYALEPTVRTQTSSSGQQEYVFAMTEDYGACVDDANRRKISDALCSTPFYSFMIAISEMCHEAVMIVNTVQMMIRQDAPGSTDTAMYCHSHKGHDTGVPLLKFLAKPTYLQPNTTQKPYTKRRFVLTLRVMPRDMDQMACADIKTLCGGDSCMVALSDEEYDICPAYSARIL